MIPGVRWYFLLIQVVDGNQLLWSPKMKRYQKNVVTRKYQVFNLLFLALDRFFGLS